MDFGFLTALDLGLGLGLGGLDLGLGLDNSKYRISGKGEMRIRGIYIIYLTEGTGLIHLRSRHASILVWT